MGRIPERREADGRPDEGRRRRGRRSSWPRRSSGSDGGLVGWSAAGRSPKCERGRPASGSGGRGRRPRWRFGLRRPRPPRRWVTCHEPLSSGRTRVGRPTTYEYLLSGRRGGRRRTEIVRATSADAAVAHVAAEGFSDVIAHTDDTTAPLARPSQSVKFLSPARMVRLRTAGPGRIGRPPPGGVRPPALVDPDPWGRDPRLYVGGGLAGAVIPLRGGHLPAAAAGARPRLRAGAPVRGRPSAGDGHRGGSLGGGPAPAGAARCEGPHV